MDRGAWWATVHGVAESQMRLSDLAQHSPHFRRMGLLFTDTEKLQDEEEAGGRA